MTRDDGLPAVLFRIKRRYDPVTRAVTHDWKCKVCSVRSEKGKYGLAPDARRDAYEHVEQHRPWKRHRNPQLQALEDEIPPRPQ